MHETVSSDYFIFETSVHNTAYLSKLTVCYFHNRQIIVFYVTDVSKQWLFCEKAVN